MNLLSILHWNNKVTEWLCISVCVQETALMAFQIGFDLYESATQQFLLKVQAAIRSAAPRPFPSKTEKPTETATPVKEEKET